MAYRLLIVPGDNQLLRELPSQFGDDVTVQLADSANDALWEVRQSAPSAIVADVDLPGMSGLDLAEIVPNFGVQTRIALWSREPNTQAEQQAAAHGVSHFFNGPQELDHIAGTLYAMMRETSAVASPEPEPAPEPAPAARAPEPAPAARAPETPVRPPASEPAPARRSSRRRPENALVLTAEHIQPIKSRMDALLQEVGAECIILTDRNGMTMTESGNAGTIPTMILLPMLSTTFSAAGQISQMLREPDSNALYVQEGQHYDLYCFDLLQSFMLVLIFDKRTSRSKIGTVWVYAKRAIRDIQEHLS